MSTTSERIPFSEELFLEDLEKASQALAAPYDEKVIREVVAAYGDLMYDAAIQVRGSNHEGVPILYRVLMSSPADTLDIATRHGWLRPDDPLVALARSVRTHFAGTTEQPEFTTDRGCDGVFLYLGGLRTTAEVLGMPGMPEGIRAQGPAFAGLHLDEIVTFHLQYTQEQVSFYFLAREPITKGALDAAVALTGAPAPTDAVYADIVGILRQAPYYLNVVMDYRTGRIVRAELQLLLPVRLPPDMDIPDVGERLATFWDMPSHEYEDMDLLTYNFGDTHLGSIFGMRSYCGGVRNQLRDWEIIGA